MDLKLKGQHVLITGSAGGIGVPVVKMFLEDALKPLIDSFKGQISLISADATKEESVVAAVNAATKQFGVINILIANHAIFEDANVPLWEMSLDQWKRTLDVNLTGIFLFVREYLRQLKAHTAGMTTEQLSAFNASIVIVGSTAGKFGEAMHADYAASKSALMYGFMRSLKNEIVKIVPKARVNCVAPGWVKTPMAEESLKRGEHFKALQTMPLKKVASTDDVGNAILFLSSMTVSGHCSGTTIEVDGGMEGRALNTLEELKKI